MIDDPMPAPPTSAGRAMHAIESRLCDRSRNVRFTLDTNL
jgi:hypothetical protein